MLMADMMTFPDTWEEFEKSYGFVDGEKIYTNGSRLIPSFRVKQWLGHIAHLGNKQQATVSSDCVSRQDAKDVVDMELDAIDHVPEWVYDRLLTALDQVPSAQPTISKMEQVGADLIDRQAAIEAIYHHFPSVSRTRARTMLHEVSSAQSDLEAKILAAGYTGKEVRIYIGGRLFGVRELAQ